ncbi:MAG: phosphatase PAP2 family protein [Betaproteobacteria bacterium]|nr:phosphatase PAP2 family protein [Betaproteobacteria bacterium]
MSQMYGYVDGKYMRSRTSNRIRTIELNKPLLGAAALMVACLLFSFWLMISEMNREWMLHIHSTPFMPAWFWSILNLGGDAWVVLLFLLLAERRPGEVTSWVLKTWILGALVAQLLKQIFPVARPASVLSPDNLVLIDHPPLISGSMPSGHALAAISCCLIVCALLHSRGVRHWQLAVIALIALLVAWARVSVGAHWPADVFAGAGLAIAVVAATHYWEKHSSWNEWFTKQSGVVFLIFLHILIALHLTSAQSQLFAVQFVQFSLSCLSLLKALSLIKENFFRRLI